MYIFFLVDEIFILVFRVMIYLKTLLLRVYLFVMIFENSLYCWRKMKKKNPRLKPRREKYKTKP